MAKDPKEFSTIPSSASNDAETVLSNAELLRYGYRRPSEGSVAMKQKAQSSEGNLSGHGQTGSTPFTVFDYLGLGFILEPPGVLVHAVMTGEKLNWSAAWYALPFIILGAIFISIGRNWETLKKNANGRVVEAVDHLSRSYLVPFIVVLFALVGVAILPIWIWPPNVAASSLNPHQLTADEIAAAVAKGIPKPQLPTAEDIATAVVKAIPQQQPPATADEIAAAVVRKLPKSAEQPSISAPSPSPKTTIFELDDARRFQLVKALRDSTIERNGLPITCHAMVNQKPNSPWASNAWEAIAPIMHYAGWINEGGRTPKTYFPAGFTLSTAKDAGDGFTCAFRLSELLLGLKIPATLRDNQVTPDLIACDKENGLEGCIEITIGDEH